ncbi:flagella synthesis protein FlgN [Thiobacillus denitrificans]|uniref:Flagellar biosynthesis protein FlgN n=1 Tax=Thiobacillus denitrificans TaxID=36861 RepID=A0A106BP89_THIDE|nr:flagellar protein FlgN [Thiobacillus denitrificans]KVW96111.1 flagellar biosynthesis protein FlgN [Thiobacillus denitrificans]
MSPNKPSHDNPSLLARLKVENTAWQALLQVLQEEEQALIEGAADRLAGLNTTKLTQLQTVSEHARNRLADLQAAGHTPDHAGMDSWLAQLGQPEARTHWQQLRDMEQAAQAMNQRIGALIELRLASTRQALNVLVHSATSQGGLYDQAGLAVAARKGKPLTAA